MIAISLGILVDGRWGKDVNKLTDGYKAMRWDDRRIELIEHKLMVKLDLVDDSVKVWRADLNLTEDQLDDLRGLLSDDEGVRANQFYFDDDRCAFVAARGILRLILGGYLGVDPAKLVFNYGDRGKPYLVDYDVSFSVSHSHGLALYAVSNYPVGIDLEWVRLVDAQRLAERFFRAGECDYICNHEDPLLGFFEVWTAKEAYLKVTGEGLWGLSEVELMFDPLRLGDDSFEVFSFVPLGGYVGAIARRC